MFIYNYFKRLTLALFVALLLSGCITELKSIKQDRDLTIQAGEGYLFMSIDTSMDLEKILITGEDTIALTKDDLQTGSNYLLLKLAAGEYRVSKVFSNLGGFGFLKRQFVLDDSYWDFEVKPQVISYIGELEVSHRNWGLSAYFQLNNRSSYALEYLEAEFPNILSSRNVEYGGPGEDRFFEFIKNQTKSPAQANNSAIVNQNKGTEINE